MHRLSILLLTSLVVAGISSATAQAQEPQSYPFIHINSENGLSQSNVKSILQDSYGFFWFGTKNGLNRYDGCSIMQYDCKDMTVPCNNHNISALCEDDEKQIWVGTDEGVYRYNPISDVFTFMKQPAKDGVVMKDWVASIRKDGAGNMWIVLPGQGIFRYHNGALHHYSFKDVKPSDLCVCSNGDVWTSGWYMGLYRYNPYSDKFEAVGQDATGHAMTLLEINTLSPQGDNLILAIQNGMLKKYNCKSKQLLDVELQDFSSTIVRNATAYGDEIWVGTYNGLYILNEKEHRVKHFKQHPYMPVGISDNIIYTTYRDKEGGMWLGTMFGGVNYLPNNGIRFSRYQPDAQDNSLSSRRIRELCEDGNGNLWIGTEDNGFNLLSLSDHSIQHRALMENDKSIKITLAITNGNGNVYYSVIKKGLVQIDKNGKAYFYSLHDMQVEGNIYAIYSDRDKNLWIGTDMGMYCAGQGRFTFDKVAQLGDNWFYDIMQERNGDLWFASMGKGVWRYTAASRQFVQYKNDEKVENSLSSNSVSSIMQDSKGQVWFSTDRGGICRFNRDKENFTRFSIEEGLPDDVAYKILEDGSGNLWFGTNHGLVCFNPDRKSIRVFGVKDGLCGNQFNYKSAVKASDGNFYFGTIEGLISFNPAMMGTTTKEHPVFITKISIFNEDLTVNSPHSPLKQSAFATTKIVLPYNRTNISFEFAMLSYSNAQSNRYYYKLSPIDKQWIDNGNSNRISYAKLLPGRYELQISAAADASMQGENVRTLTIVVLPPWWWSPIAIILYVVFGLLAITLWFLWYRRYKNRQLMERQKLFEVEKEKELYENKVSFFTEIAHEIRTPLTLINGPLEIIEEMDIKDNKLLKNLQVIAQNTKRLLDLVAQLFEFQKVGENKFKLNFEVVDISFLLQETINRFEPTFTHKNKEIIIDYIEPDVMAKVDKESITKILSNLLNNALKYGQHHVEVGLHVLDDNFVVSVASDGPKIPVSKAKQIFEPFVQLNNEEGSNRQGVGIGLALSITLAHMHKGELYLDVERKENTFILTIPTHIKESISQEELMGQVHFPLNENLPEETNTKGNVILIVEDDEEILQFMKERLAEFYIVETALNGEPALDILHKDHIDLVISDVMMPHMDGMELCKAVKSDINLSHIPFIFLTAKNDINSKIQGLKMGAEAYIEKPFSFEYLKTQINSLLNNRQKEREAFSKRPFFSIENMQMSREDEEFMNKVMKVINDNINDETFNVESMADALCMSRSSLLRKIKTLFNLSPIDFIRLIRLKRAAELIQEGKYRVGEICYMVGFSSHSYFSKLFCKQFGMPPKDFEKQVESTRTKVRAGQEIKLDDLLQNSRQEEK